MFNRLKNLTVILLVAGVFLVVSAGPSFSMFCQMGMKDCHNCCGKVINSISPNPSVEAVCVSDCCLSVNKSLGAATLSEWNNNFFHGKVKSLGPGLAGSVSDSALAYFHDSPLDHPEFSHPNTAPIYLLNKHLLI